MFFASVGASCLATNRPYADTPLASLVSLCRFCFEITLLILSPHWQRNVCFMELESSRPVGVRTLAHFARRRLANNLREQGAAQGVTALLGGWDEVSACYTFGAQYVSAVVVIGPCGGDWGTIFTAREHRTRHVKVVACSLSALLMQSCSNARFTRCRIHITGLIALGRSQLSLIHI